MARRISTRTIVALACATLVTLSLAQVASAEPPPSSGAVTRFTDVFAVAYFDEADGLVALGGPPPEEGCIGEGFDDPAEIMEVLTGSGVLMGHIIQVDLPVFVYDLTLGFPCEILAAGGTVEPLFVGTIRTVWNDNDFIVTGTRANSFGGSSTGWVTDADGNACRFSAHVRLLISPDGEFRVLTEDITIAC